jgi:hypothetical protein
MANYEIGPEGGREPFQILSMEGCHSHVAFRRLLGQMGDREREFWSNPIPVCMIPFLQLGSLFATPHKLCARAQISDLGMVEN